MASIVHSNERMIGKILNENLTNLINEIILQSPNENDNLIDSVINLLESLIMQNLPEHCVIK